MKHRSFWSPDERPEPKEEPIEEDNPFRINVIVNLDKIDEFEYHLKALCRIIEEIKREK